VAAGSVAAAANRVPAPERTPSTWSPHIGPWRAGKAAFTLLRRAIHRDRAAIVAWPGRPMPGATTRYRLRCGGSPARRAWRAAPSSSPSDPPYRMPAVSANRSTRPLTSSQSCFAAPRGAHLVSVYYGTELAQMSSSCPSVRQ
jgi:hypothetical protein